MKIINENTYKYLGILNGLYAFQNIRYSNKEFVLVDCVKFIKSDGSCVYLEMRQNQSDLAIDAVPSVTH